MRDRQRASLRGFTLVEVLVAVALLALMSAVVVPAVANLARLDLRRGSRQLASNVRRAFDEAALTGRTYRVTFRLPRPKGAPKLSKLEEEEPLIGIAAADAGITFSGRDGALRLASDDNLLLAQSEDLSSFDSYFAGSGQAAGQAVATPAAEPNQAAEPSASAATFQAMFGINELAKRGNQASFEAVGEVTLPHGISVYAVWTSGMVDAETHGSVSLLFFPTGYTQDAIVYLADERGNAMSVSVQALTGQCTVTDGSLAPGDFEVDA